MQQNIHVNLKKQKANIYSLSPQDSPTFIKPNILAFLGPFNDITQTGYENRDCFIFNPTNYLTLLPTKIVHKETDREE